ncbi:hypothetical protein KAU33_14395, partial [Candidatus Dependentiae bacterium]|nr:hypothetical protein [Candidatus Dependentiae bacterium]
CVVLGLLSGLYLSILFIILLNFLMEYGFTITSINPYFLWSAIIGLFEYPLLFRYASRAPLHIQDGEKKFLM